MAIKKIILVSWATLKENQTYTIYDKNDKFSKNEIHNY